MGRLKFEKEFKEKLDRREIKPSENSWEKLSSQLDSEEKSSKINLWWLGIAATILAGILIIGLQYRNSPVESTPQVVDAPVEKVRIDKKENTDANINKGEELPVLKDDNSRVAIRSQKESLKNNTQKAKAVQLNEPAKKYSTEEKPGAIASMLEPIGINEKKDSAVYSKSDDIISQKLSEVIAQVNTMNSNGDSVSDSEVDKLLAQAATQIKKERDYNFSVGKIDPDDLLQSVEMDIEYSFREKVFDVLKEGYLKAKTAVANRNY